MRNLPKSRDLFRSFLTAGFMLVGFCVVGASTFFVTPAHAEYEHERVRRVVVFPLQADAEFSKETEETWWRLREHLTESKRFMVASRNFMQSKDVFQPRAELKPADALILGRLLDANALITTFLVDHKLSMRVYETKNGLTLWATDLELHPSIPVSKQIEDGSLKLLNDLIFSIPYQGFVIVDPMIARASYSEGDKQFFKADIGLNTQVAVGDSAQLVRVQASNLNPIFQQGLNVDVYVEGTVVKVDRQIVTVQVTRKGPKVEIKADALVRIPDELKRMREAYGMTEDPLKNIGVEMYRTKDDELTDKQKDRKPLITSLAFIGNIAAILLLAF
jgi:hypothetical protein